jgi:type I restriction enzyme S subunit
MKTIKSQTEPEIIEFPKLPEEWRWVKIGELCSLVNGRAFKPVEWSSHGVPIVRIQNLNNTEAEFNYCDFQVEDKYYFNNGQLLFAWSGTPGTSFGAHIWNRGEAVLNQHIFKVNINEFHLNKKFLMYVLNWNITEYVKKAHGTAGLAHITKNKFETSFIPFAPLPEQRAIVSKIELLFSELDNGIANLKLAQEQLKVYRQAVLKKAFEGELTKKWREQQTDLPDAEELLEQTKKKRKEAENISGKKVKSVNPLTELELDGLLRLPEEWKWVKVGELCDVVRGGSPRPAGDPKYYGGEIPFLKVADLTRNDGIYLKKYEYTIKEAGLTRTRLVKQNTLLLSNSGATLGIPKICSFKTTLNDGIAAFLDLAEDSLVYHYYFWLSKTKELRAINQGAAQPNLNTDIISNYPIPLCSLPEQQAIVQEIETRLSVCDKIEKDIADNLERAEALRQSILKKAFEGKLLNEKELEEVRKAEDWEPAEVLLERIKAEKTENEKKSSKL